jgi:hypothetical protein
MSTHLHQYSLEVLTHGDAAQFDTEVADLEARALRFDLRLLLGGVDAGHLVHQQIKETVSHQRDRLVARFQDGEHGRRLFGVM